MPDVLAPVARGRWLAPALLLLATVSTADAAARPEGHDWVFANDSLQISVDGRTGAWQARDRRCGHVWRQAVAGDRKQWVVPVARRTAPVILDGQLPEWPGQGLTPAAKLLTPGRPDTAGGDGGGPCQLAWDDQGCWLAAAVRDDDLVPFEPGANLWDVDAVELWLGQDHWGFAASGERVEIVCWSDPARAEGCRAAFARTATGWNLEAFVPWSRVTGPGRPPRPGDETLLALGIDDADGAPGRRCQLFYPAGYRHKVFETHAVAVWSATGGSPRRESRAPSETVVEQVRPLPAPAEGVSLSLRYTREANQNLPLQVHIELLPEAGDVAYTIDGASDLAIADLALPAPFILDAAAGQLVIPHQSGLLFGVEELEWAGRSLGGMYSMPWFGAADLATGQGYVAILETPDDATFRGAKVAGEGRDVLAVQAVQRPQKGLLGYPRRMLYHFADRGGYVALAKRYRGYAAAAGLLKTLREKRRERPAIDKLVGAVDIYAGADFGNVEELRQLGIERAMIYGFSGDRAREINEFGYLTTRYDIYTDLYEPGTPPSKWERCEGFSFPDDVIKKADGANQVGWCPIPNPATGQDDPSYVICWSRGLRTLRQKMPHRLAESPCNAYFLDCVTSAGLYECYDPQHPLTRTTDREARSAQFGYLSGDLGLVVGSEAGRDWAVPTADYFEGLMSTATWMAAPPELHGLPFEAIESNARYEEYGLNAARRVPLFQLVYGDCCETTWWWGDNNTRMYSAWAQKDLLQMIHASMPMWVLWRPQQGLFLGNLDRFKACYDQVCRWRRVVGYDEMVDHQRLSPDGLLQRSSFANGASVTVNFAKEPRTLPEGGSLPGRSYRLDGEAVRQAGLAVGQPVTVDDTWRPKELVATGNTGFESRPTFWSPAAGMSLEVQDDVVRSGARAAHLSGTQRGGWSYANAVSVPLEPGRRYRLRGWLRVDALSPPQFAPGLKCQVNRDGQYLTNFFTPVYDLARLGTWQVLEAVFTAPAEATSGQLALEKRTTETVEASLYLDDVELAPAEE